MPFKPLKEKSLRNSFPASQTGPMTPVSSPIKAEYSYLTEITSDKTSSNYTMITQQPDTPVT